MCPAGYYLLDRNGPGRPPDWINKFVWEAELSDQGSEPTPKEEDLDAKVEPECTTPVKDKPIETPMCTETRTIKPPDYLRS